MPKLYVKKSFIIVIERTKEGDYLVCDSKDTQKNDTWIVPKAFFEENYEVKK